MQTDGDNPVPTSSTVPQQKEPGWWPAVICIAALLALGSCVWVAREGALARQEETEMAVRLSRMDGHQLCNLAYLSSTPAVLNGRTPSIYAPERVLIGPPAVFECPMLRKGGVEAEPLTVIRLCTDLREDCVETR